MNFFRGFLIFAFVIGCGRAERVRLDAKKIVTGKVLAKGYSIPAKSLSHCIEYCNRRRKTCDGVVFHEIIQKCRLVSKCAAAHQVDNSSSIVYYSRRPQTDVATPTINPNTDFGCEFGKLTISVLTSGYIYDPISDSCIGVIASKVNYATADGICRKQNAHLVKISRRKVNQIASKLLTESGIKWAWINDENVAHETKIKPHGISGNDVRPQEVFAPEVVHWRNNSYRSCWGVNDGGQWGQFSCKNDTMVVLCQVLRF